MINIDHYSTMKNLPAMFKRRMIDCYIQEWFSKTRASKCLSHLATLKDGYNMSEYLLNVKNISCRKIITKLRTGSHKLSFGTLNKRTDNTNLCEVCNIGCVENVDHLLLKCNRHANARTELFNKMVDIPGIELENDSQKLKVLLNFQVDRATVSNSDMSGIAIKYVTEVCKIRGIT